MQGNETVMCGFSLAARLHAPLYELIFDVIFCFSAITARSWWARCEGSSGQPERLDEALTQTKLLDGCERQTLFMILERAYHEQRESQNDKRQFDAFVVVRQKGARLTE